MKFLIAKKKKKSKILLTMKEKTMTKLILAIVAALTINTSAFASGKLMAQGVHSFATDKHYLNLVGLSIYEPVLAKKVFFYDGFMGRIYNEYSSVDTRETYTVKNMLGMRLGNLEISAGHQYVNAMKVGVENRGIVKAAIKLW